MEQTNRSLRVAVIGVGNIGHVHAESIRRGDIESMTLCALCDSDKRKAEYLKEEYPDIPVFTDHKTLISSGICDTVIISTPHKYHPVIACDAFEAGLNVMSEKPAGIDTASVKAMSDAAKRSGKAFGIMFNQRTNPLFARARDMVRSGKIGKPKRLTWIITNWYRSQAYYDSGEWRASWNGEGGGVLLNQAPHNLDLWQWIFGMPKRVRAFCYKGKYHDIPVEDDATIYAEYENGATATFITSTGELPGTNRLEIIGDLGKIVLEQGALVFSELSCSEREYCYSARTIQQPQVSVSRYNDKNELSGHTLILQNFARHILLGEELISPGYDGIYELGISCAAYLSSHKDAWVDIPFDDGEYCALLEEYKKAELPKAKPAEQELSGSTYKDRWKVQW